MLSYLEIDNRRIAYHKFEGQGIGVVFLGGFKSDMEGTKAIHLQQWAKANNRPFLRFDYTGSLPQINFELKKDSGSLMMGVYLIRINSRGRMITSRFIKL